MSAKPLVLIVDDDAELSAMVAELLGREGWAVHAVLTGGDGAPVTLAPGKTWIELVPIDGGSVSTS